MANKSKKIDERIEEAYRNSILEKKSRKPKLKEAKSKLPIKIKAAIISLLTSATELILIYYGKFDWLKKDSDDKYDIAKIIFIWGIITWIIGMVSTFK